MKARRSLPTFLQLLKSRGQNPAQLTPAQGIDAMLAFYRATRADDCEIEQDGDMLLYQWGTYDWGHGPSFEFDITRQFITGDGDDDDIWQLSLTFKFPPSESLAALGKGDRWCPSPATVDELESFILASNAYSQVRDQTDATVELDYDCAG